MEMVGKLAVALNQTKTTGQNCLTYIDLRMNESMPVMNPVLDGESDPSGESSWLRWGDSAGMIASVGCAIHCAAMPFVIAYLPALGLSFLADEAFHKWMAVACFGIALLAFIPGLRKHGRLTPVLIGSVGLVMISFAAFGLAGECCAACATDSNSAIVAADTCTEACCADCAAAASASAEASVDAGNLHSPVSLATQFPWLATVAPWLTPIGGIVLVTAHLLNRRFGCLCGCCETRPVGDTV